MKKKTKFVCCESDSLSCGVCGLRQRSSDAEELPQNDPEWIVDKVSTAAGVIPRVSTKLTPRDVVGSWKARLGIKRMNYNIRPGLYCVGHPDSDSPVFVTANYKMSFDRLRRELVGTDAWIMVLNTQGINVWCAAGKGTFGTAEVVRRISEVKLEKVVTHRTIILPQLGAPGVAAHEVRRQSGFRVLYGPVKAEDLAAFLRAGMRATPRMREVGFGLRDRLVLIPVELVAALKPALIIFGIIFALRLAGVRLFRMADFVPFLGAILAGSALVPLLLPWIPGRAFAWKGWLVGLLWALAYGLFLLPQMSWKRMLVNLLILPAISSFLAMNFTGSSTYTSLSGVVREMKIALPLIVFSASAGIVFYIVNLFIRF